MHTEPIVELSHSATPTPQARNELIFVTLLLLTLASCRLADYLQGKQLSHLILLIVLIKTGLVASNFMGLRDVTRSWQWPMATYLITLVTVLALIN